MVTFQKRTRLAGFFFKVDTKGQFVNYNLCSLIPENLCLFVRRYFSLRLNLWYNVTSVNDDCYLTNMDDKTYPILTDYFNIREYYF